MTNDELMCSIVLSANLIAFLYEWAIISIASAKINALMRKSAGGWFGVAERGKCND